MTKKGSKDQGIKTIFRFLSNRTFFFALVLTLPFVAQASIISIVSGLFTNGEKEEALSQNSPNSQKMALLQADITPSSSIGGADIKIISGNALLSETGPAGGQSGALRESGQISVYVVREGDSLSQIAEMFDVSVNTVKWGNDIKGSTITPGQTLVILPISGVKHIVKSGDTLESVTKLYKGDLEEVLIYNNISESSKLAVGDIVIVPGGVLKSSSSVAAPSPRSSSSGSRPVYEGYYMRPVPSGTRSQGIHGYNAIDLAAPVGTPILASASGVVTVSRSSGWNGGYGSYVVISHSNGTQTLYAHNSRNNVTPGEQISQGQVIGYIGQSGRATGPHVHFEIRGAGNPF